jgi:hypothetical protein
MNSKQKSLQHLLDDVVTPQSDCGHLGPNRSTILDMVSHERARRRQARRCFGAASGAGVCAFVALLFMQQSPPPQELSVMPQTVQTAPTPPPPLTIREVDDKQLLELLKDSPVALMEWPDGKRTLLVMGR